MIRYPIPSFFTLPAKGVGGGVQSAPHIGRVGCWLLAAGCWPEVAGDGLCTFAATGLAASFWLLATGRSFDATPLPIGCGLPATGCWPQIPAGGFCKSAATTLQIASGGWLLASGRRFAATLLPVNCWPEIPAGGFCKSAATGKTSLSTPQPGAPVPQVWR